jgi:hypothetical protein
MEGEFDMGPNGFFITVGASIADSPVVVHLSEPGWADFGFGELPEAVLPAPVVPAVSMWQRSTADGPLMELFTSTLEARRAANAPGATQLDRTVPGAIDSYTGESIERATVRTIQRRWPPASEGIAEVERRRFSRLRQARDLSLAQLSQRLQDQTGIRASRDTLRRFETDVGRPHAPLLPVALDHVLGAGGRLAMLELRAGRGAGSVQFPPFWRGPFWVSLDNQGEGGRVELRRGDWNREVVFTEPTVVAAHWFDPTIPIRIDAPDSVTWAVGVGRRVGSRIIDQNWVPGRVDVAQEAVSAIETAIYEAVDRSTPAT